MVEIVKFSLYIDKKHTNITIKSMLSSTTFTTVTRISPTLGRRALLPATQVALQRFAAAHSCWVSQQRLVHTATPKKDNVIILGAAGRDFHDFITYWSTKPNTEVKAFTGQQIPGIDRRTFPAELCNNKLNGNLYPNGIKIHPERNLEALIRFNEATTCALAYSDLSYDTVQSLASRVNATGCNFVQIAPARTMVSSTKPLIAVCASRTGVGKSQTTRYIANYYKNKGLRVVVIRHPMPYDKDIMTQRCQRYEELEDMDKYHCTIEEREEYYRHIEDGNLLFAGVDYPMILKEAEKDADGECAMSHIILWSCRTR